MLRWVNNKAVITRFEIGKWYAAILIHLIMKIISQNNKTENINDNNNNIDKNHNNNKLLLHSAYH